MTTHSQNEVLRELAKTLREMANVADLAAKGDRRMLVLLLQAQFAMVEMFAPFVEEMRAEITRS